MINARFLKIASIVTLLAFTWFSIAADFTFAEQEQSEPRSDIIYKEGKKKKFPVLLIVAGVAAAGVVILLLLKKKDGKPDPGKFDTEVLGFEWVTITAGEFTMGDNSNEAEANEKPEHQVSLSQYEISKYEVTFDQYDYFCDDTGRAEPESMAVGRGKHPVINISWEDANAFCAWLSGKTTGKTFSLPTEAQWEKAARGTEKFKYPWGNDSPTCDLANYNNCIGTATAEVGSYPDGGSPYGVFDMAGNVWEWCKDWYDGNYYNISGHNDPQGPVSGTSRVVRGGCYSSNANNIRTAERSNHDPQRSFQYIGFRICRYSE